ncbi:MAG: pilin [Xanthomonadales bacterium]|nr:pilin [Xanthomonadales bacterium]ODU93064.1 MAG: hypothetical protein ABT18_09885 [Rhodanobacter sp. SCN 66-43]OJY83767.1 MAG: hypothetical protein BGP23_14125 [Xanthomonadales bacterium 66-474]
MRKTLVLSVLVLAVLAALGGCSGGGNNAASAPAVAAAVLPHATHDPVAEYNQYRTTSQLAEGLMLAGSATMAINTYYGIHGKLPTSDAQAESVEPRSAPKFSGPGKYVGSVAVGPEPGVITVGWASGVLEGKILVLLPKRAGRLCWKVDTASTTVPADALAHANIVGKCYDDE